MKCGLEDPDDWTLTCGTEETQQSLREYLKFAEIYKWRVIEGTNRGVAHDCILRVK